MSNFKKRTFSQFQHEKAGGAYIDLSVPLPPEPKKQKLDHTAPLPLPLSIATSQIPKDQTRSPSIQILSVHIPQNKANKPLQQQQRQHQPDPPSVSCKKILHRHPDNKENIGDVNNSNNDSTTIETINKQLLNDNDFIIIEHRLQNEWFHFKIVSKPNDSRFLWLKHNDLKHLLIYKEYLKKTNLTLGEVSEPQYIIEAILDHQYNEETDDLQFHVKWKGYEDTTWEPPTNMKGNISYIKYCKNHCIKPMLFEPMLYDSSSSEEEEEVTTDTDTDTEEEEEEEDVKESISGYNPIATYNTIDITTDIINTMDITDVYDEYNASLKQNKAFTVYDIQDIIHAIDGRMQFLFRDALIHSNENNHNHKNTNNNNNAQGLEIEMNKLMDIREYFEAIKGELNNNNNNNKADEEGDDVMIIEKDIINLLTPPNKKKKKRKTLFDYSFTPEKVKKSISSTTRKPKQMKQSKRNNNNTTLFTSIRNNNHQQSDEKFENQHNEETETEAIPYEYILHTSTCYACKRKWPLYGVELFKSFPICNKCPTNIRLGHNRKFKEDWFCPYCHHSAKCVLFASLKSENNDNINIHYDFGTNGTSLTAICNSTHAHKPYLYIKPNGSKYWKTYIPVSVNNEETGDIWLCQKNTTRKHTNIILSNIDIKYILWAYNDATITQRLSKDVTNVRSLDNEWVTVKVKDSKSAKSIITVRRGEVITTNKYLVKLCTEIGKRKHIKFDRAKIFKYSRYLVAKRREKVKKKNEFGAKTVIKESAPLNSRYFNADIDNNSDMSMDRVIPNYSNTTAELLAYCTLSAVPENVLQAPLRQLNLQQIEKYPLILIVGPSGSGKSTLLKSLQAQNPSLITFKNPDHLHWHRNKCVISEFDGIPIETAMDIMSSIGLNNIRTWLKPYHILSAGERYKSTFARLLQESISKPNGIILMDEFTSVLDRTNARCMSAAASKCIRKFKSKYNNKTSNFVLASGNADIIRYLQPDLLVLLGGDNGMKLIENPNNLKDNRKLFDVKAVLNLPQFNRKKEDDALSDYKSIQKLTIFDDLRAYNKPICIDNMVRQLKCKVDLDSHAKQTSVILDVEDFEGECITHIPCLLKKHIFPSSRGTVKSMNNFFNIGIIVGPSGSGKTTSGERLFGKPADIKWDNVRDIASHFQSENIIELLSAVHLSASIAFSRYHFLSEGEQHRVNIARYLDGDDNVLIDEFTSYLDRITAKKVAKGVSDYIYKYNKKNIVFLCCKYDIISYKNGIYPSWIFDVQNKKITHYKPIINVDIDSESELELNLYPEHKYIDITNLWNPPKIRLVLKLGRRTDFAPTFSKYHYMDASISAAAKCWSVWAHFSHKIDGNANHNKSDKEEASDNDEDDGDYNENELELVGFISVINHYGANYIAMHDETCKKYIHFREHRTVILPSFQGLGFGSRIADCMGEYLALHGLRLHSKTAHPRYGGYRDKQPSLWIPTKNNGEKMARREWKKDKERILFGNVLKNVGMEKTYHVHVYKLHQDKERTERVNQLLKTRVIVKKSYGAAKQ